MTQYEFSLLTQEQQIDALLKGVIVNFQKNDEHAIMLQKLGDFYVEIFFDKRTVDIIISTKASDRRLGFFLN